MASGGVEKQIEKLRAKVDSGSFYEAQQIFKTVYHRYRSRKQLQDAYQLLEEGAVMQFDRDQVSRLLPSHLSKRYIYFSAAYLDQDSLIGCFEGFFGVEACLHSQSRCLQSSL